LIIKILKSLIKDLGILIPELGRDLLDFDGTFGSIIPGRHIFHIEETDSGLILPGGPGLMIKPVHQGLVDNGAPAHYLGPQKGHLAVMPQFHTT